MQLVSAQGMQERDSIATSTCNHSKTSANDGADAFLLSPAIVLKSNILFLACDFLFWDGYCFTEI